MATYWRTDGVLTTGEPVKPKNGTDFSGDELRFYVGGFFEVVRLDDRTLMVVNEDGQSRNLPMNVVGTTLYDLMARRNGHPNGANGHPILGDVLICDREEIT